MAPMKEGREEGGALMPPGKVIDTDTPASRWKLLSQVVDAAEMLSEGTGGSVLGSRWGALAGFHPAVVAALICKRLALVSQSHD